MKLRISSAVTLVLLFLCGSSTRAQDLDDNLAALRSAADAGDAKGLFALGNRCFHGQGVEQDYRQALVYFRGAADQGFAPAQNALGTMYERGLGVPKDYLGAMNYFRQAANQGYALAQYNVGRLYDTGRGSQIDNQQAFEWFMKAARQGQPDAEEAVGLYYQRGLGVAQVFSWAFDWYRKAADHGSALAESDLGHMYETGLGVQPNYEQALAWYYKSAQQGNSFGEINIGHMYEKGLGVEIDYAQALMWYRRAANQGNLYAANNLGWMYEKGEGVPQDYGRALAWYKVAANKRFKTAIENIELVTEKLQPGDPAQLDAANRYAQKAVHELEDRIARRENLEWEITELELDAKQVEGVAAQMEQPGSGVPAVGVNPVNAMDARKFRMEARIYRYQAGSLRQGLTETDEQQTASFSPQTAAPQGTSMPTPVAAFNRAGSDEGDDPPGRVAQLRYIRGPVSFEPAGTDDWIAPSVNRPLTTGDKLWTDQEARAELGTDSAKIRLNGLTGFSFLNLNDHITQIRLTEGTVQIHLRRLDDDESFEVDTPNLALSLLRPGDYRLDVNENGSTVVTIRAGAGEVTAGGLAIGLRAGQTGTFVGTDEISQDIEPIEDRDDFDNWCRGRDHREEHTVSARYVSPDVIGYEDLDNYGEWRHVPQYGDVWVPTTVPAGWAPYHYGHWAWISPWGWTWVDDAPWGFAPFHYGRWAYVDGHWVWCPGPVVAEGRVAPRPVYAPALVAWVGSARLGQSNATGVAWFPLGPREVYVPPYQVSKTYVTNINVTNTTLTNTSVTNVYNSSTNINSNATVTNVNVTNVNYVNKVVPGAVIAVPQGAFASAQPVAKAAVQVDTKQLGVAKVATNNIVVAPQPKSVLEGAAPSANVPKPPDSTLNRPVIAKVAPPPPPIPFAVQQKIIQANGGHPVSSAEIHRQQPQQQLSPASAAPVKIAPPVPLGSNQRGGRPSLPGQNDVKQDQRVETGPLGKEGLGKPVGTGIPRDQAKPAAPQNSPNRDVPSPLAAKPQDHASQPQISNVTSRSEVKENRQEQGQPAITKKSDTQGDQRVTAEPAVSVSKSQSENKASGSDSPKNPSTSDNTTGNRPSASPNHKDQQKPSEPKGDQKKDKQTQQKQKPDGKQQPSDRPTQRNN